MTGEYIEYIRNKPMEVYKHVFKCLYNESLQLIWLYTVLWNRIMLVAPSAGLPAHKFNPTTLIKSNQTYVSSEKLFFCLWTF